MPSPHLPVPRRDRWSAWLFVAVGAVGAVLLMAAVAGMGGGKREGSAALAPPAGLPQALLTTEAPIPVPAPAPAHVRAHPREIAPRPRARTERAAEARFARNDASHVRADWVAGFYRIYEAASKRFGVNWLLIASIHKQETAFSTSRGTYQGLNFANCCAGPMQFNVTNGPVSTWDRFGRAYELAPGKRPRAYNHPTDAHPSVYDDYDAIMAAAALLRTSGAGPTLDAGAWRAAYDYYGHDLTGVGYANQVLARAIGWGRRGFCINCSLDDDMLGAVDAAWGAPVRGSLSSPGPRALIAKAPR